MTTILATWELGRAFGHVAHVAPVARALRRRGVATAFAARDVLTAAQVADHPFARILQAPLYQRPVARVPTLTYAQAIADGGMGDPDHATVLVAAWLQLIDGLRPDALVAEFAPVSLLAAHVAGLGAVRTGSSWVVPIATCPLPSLMPWLPDDPAARIAAGAVADAVVETVCRRFGASPLDGLCGLLATAPRLLGTWPELDHNGAVAGETYYGPMTGLAATARPAWPDRPGPRTFVYLPFDHPGAGPLAEALGELDWPALWHAPTPPPVPLPPNCSFVAEPVDTPHVLAEAVILAGRGGHATSCEAMRRGTAQLIIPDTLETTLIGWRLTGQRLARVVPGSPDTATLRAALTALAGDERVAAALAVTAARYARYDPVAAEDQLAADLLAALRLA